MNELIVAAQPRDWEQRFEEVLKSEIYEQFNMLLCNPLRSPEKQKQLLHAILFVDHKSPRYWNQYLVYMAENCPQKKESLITLVFKALSVIPEASNKDQPDFIRLHLRLAALDQYVYCQTACVLLAIGWTIDLDGCLLMHVVVLQGKSAHTGSTTLQDHAEARHWD